MRALLILPIAILVGLAGCTDENSQGRDTPSPQASPSTQTSPTALPFDEAKAQLKKLRPDLTQETLQGAGSLDEHMGNTLAGRPAKGATVEFIFTCSGTSRVRISVQDTDTTIPGASGELRCGGADAFARTLPVTTKSALSFQATTDPAAEGGFAYAWFGDIR